MIFYIIASVCLGILTVACHNYIHRKPNWRMYLFNLSMWSYRDFRVSHVISHHIYPNTLMDLEISGLEPILFFNPGKNKPWHGQIGFIVQFIFFPFLFLASFIKRFLLIFFRQGFFKQHYRWHDAIGLLLPLWMWCISGESFTRVLYDWIWINCIGSLLFYSIGSNAAHHHPDTIKDGDEPNQTPDWAVHQLEAVLDRREFWTEVNSNIFTIMTLFGDHALHHLFPTLDHGLLKHLYPVFLEMCDKHQAKYRVSTQFKMVVGQLKDVTRTNTELSKTGIKCGAEIKIIISIFSGQYI